MLEELLRPHIPERFLHDRHYREGQIRVVNPLPGVPILGVHIPVLRQIAIDLSKEGSTSSIIDQFVRKESEDSRSGLLYEEKMLWGMLLNRLPCSLTERLSGFTDFIPAIDNWAVCDTICADAKWCKRNLTETWDFLQPYFQSTHEFEVRFAIVMSLDHFLADDYLDAVFEQISQLEYSRILSDYEFSKSPSSGLGQVSGPAPYYVNMAVAWLLATALYRFPKKTRAFVRSGAVPEEIIKLYIRKAKESFRTRDVAPL